MIAELGLSVDDHLDGPNQRADSVCLGSTYRSCSYP